MGTGGAAYTIAQAIQQVTSAANVRSVFGEPQIVGDRTIIPVADVAFGLGFGLGGGRATTGDVGSGGGGGGGSRTRPVAVIVVEPQGVTMRPVVDATQIVMAAVTASVFTMLWMRRLGRRAVWLKAGGEPSPEKVAKLIRGQ